MTSKLTVNVSEKVAAKYGQDTFVEFMAEACSAMGLNELNDGMIDLRWNSNEVNSRLAENVIMMTVGMWEVSLA